MFMDYIAIVTLVVFVLHKSLFVLASFSLAFALPMILISPIAGIVADKLPSKCIMFITMFFCGLLTIGLVFSKTILPIVIIIVTRGILKLFYSPCETKVIRQIFKDNELAKANSLTQVIVQSSNVMGPAVGGVMLLYFSPHYIFVFTSICYFISSFLLSRLSIPVIKLDLSDPYKNSIRYFKNMFSAFHFFLEEKSLLLILLGLCTTFFCLFLSDSMVSFLVKFYKFPAFSYSLVISVMGVGGVIGALLYSHLSSKLSSHALLSFALVCMGVSICLSSSVSEHLGHLSLIFFLSMWFFVGLSIAFVPIIFQVEIQSKMPHEMLGRGAMVLSVITGVNMLCAPMLGAIIAHVFGIQLLFFITGLAIILCGLIIQSMFMHFL